jgi:flavin reductase (DIM6/NTAB) family NADH-FMN oxidoreductase RutF
VLKINPKEVSQPKFHQFMLGAVAPRPIALASTVDKDGNPNLAPFSFFNAFSSNPPILVFSPARSGIDGTLKHTLENVYETGEVVINSVSHAMVQQTSLSSTAYPKNINEFEKAGFTELASELVKPFRVKESPVQFECKVNDVIELGDKGGAGNLVICEVLLMHISEDVLNENQHIDAQLIDLVSRMGGGDYCRASGSSVFAIEKPIAKRGMGIDNLPEYIKNSKVLTGNNLGQLGNFEKLPEKSAVKETKQNSKVKALTEKFSDTPEELHFHLQVLAKESLDNGNGEFAWRVLMLNAESINIQY